MTLPARVGFFGDSVTANIGTPSRWFGADAARWQANGFAGYTSGMLLDIIREVAAPADVDSVVIQCGLNDISTGVDPNLTQANIASMVAAVRALGVSPLLGTVLPIYPSYPNAAALTSGIDALNAWLATWAAAHTVPLIDYHATFTAAGDTPAIFRPGEAHPNTDGYAIYTATAGYTLGSGTTLVRTAIVRDFPATSGESLVSFAWFDGATIRRRNVTFRPGDPGYTGPTMSDSALDALARAAIG